MLRISDEEYRSLEMKIQAEVRKIFSQFLKDREQKNNETPDADVPSEPQICGEPLASEPLKPVPAMAKPGKRRAHGKSVKMERFLTSPAQSGPKSPARILEENMDQIFRKRKKRGSG